MEFRFVLLLLFDVLKDQDFAGRKRPFPQGFVERGARKHLWKKPVALDDQVFQGGKLTAQDHSTPVASPPLADVLGKRHQQALGLSVAPRAMEQDFSNQVMRLPSNKQHALRAQPAVSSRYWLPNDIPNGFADVLEIPSRAHTLPALAQRNEGCAQTPDHL